MFEDNLGSFKKVSPKKSFPHKEPFKEYSMEQLKTHPMEQPMENSKELPMESTWNPPKTLEKCLLLKSLIIEEQCKYLHSLHKS